jgi:hypothetical protein
MNSKSPLSYAFCCSICVLVAFFYYPVLSIAQQAMPGALPELSTVRNQVVADTLTGMSLDVILVSPLPKNGKVQVVAVGGGGPLPIMNRVSYTPNPGFVGVDTFTVGLNYLTGYPYLVFKRYRVLVAPSLVNAAPDYAVTNAGQGVYIPAINNDRSTASGALTLHSVAAVNYGTAVIDSDNRIYFTPAPGFTGIAHVNYRVCDALNTCKNGQAMIGVSAGAPVHDTLRVATAKNNPIFMPLPRSGYRIFSPPANGQLVMRNSSSFEYRPNKDFIGTDPFVLAIGAGTSTRYKRVQMAVLNTPNVNKMAIADIVATPVNQSVTLNVRTNDVGNLTVRNWVSPPAQQGTISNTNTGGNVTFTPAPGFSGVATFGYVLGNFYVPNIETGTVQVLVGNQDPITRTYQLSTPVAKPLAIRYAVPFANYNFTVTRSARQGTVVYYPGQTTQTIDGQSVTGYNMLIYTPNNGFTGLDSFTVMYCITPNGNCTSTKIRVAVAPVPGSGSSCQNACVWPGDANADGIANGQDLLTIGAGISNGGPARSSATAQWYGQHATPWNNPFVPLSTDLKYADSDGNGLINAADTTFVVQSFGKTHALRPLVPTLGNGLPFSLNLLTPNPKKGDKVQIEVILGTEANPMVNLRGFTFDFNVTGSLRDSALRMEFYKNSWVNMNSPVLWLQKSTRRGRLETALARTGDLLGHGSGAVGRIEFIVIDIVDGGKPGSEEAPYIIVSIDHPTLYTGSGATSRSETGASCVLKIPIGQGAEQPEKATPAARLLSYPAPVQQELNLSLDNNAPIQAIRLTDMTGKTLFQQSYSTETTNLVLPMHDYAPGLYVVSVKTADGWMQQKVQKISN